jgi:glutamate/tyrosine decarboxylase-like PLP-dependent enzyme
LTRCNSSGTHADYLFQKDKFYDVTYDTGDKSVQCGRKVDAFKLWVMWKARGDDGIERLVDDAFHMAEYCINSPPTHDGQLIKTSK